MKIIQLQSENVKRLSAVNIKPDGSTVVIGGKNGAGKTSVLDSIMYALAGGDTLPAKPLRNGADKGQIVVKLDGMTVTRKFTRKKATEDTNETVATSLEIKRDNGDKAGTPQAILNELCGKMAFDPLEFSRMKPKLQLDSLRQLVGLDFAEMDRQRAVAFDKRTDINRQVKAKAAELAACPATDAPAALVSVADLMAELQKRNALNEKNAAARTALADEENDHVALGCEAGAADDRVVELEEQLAAAKKSAAEARQKVADNDKRLASIRQEVAALEDADVAEVQDKITSADAINQKVRQNERRATLEQAVVNLEADSQSLTQKLEAIDKQKSDAMESAPFPVPGLGFDADGVTLNGLPFSQASSAEQLRVSVAMGLAVNPKLRVMLIRDGSLLDEDSLALVSEMADEADAQVWIERVGEGEEVSVIIEDGHVKAEAEALLV